jgi:putative ABC transport system permease protein
VKQAHLPLLERLWMRSFLRGGGAEYVVGDIVEHFAEERETLGEVRARRRLRRRVVASCVVWWRPSVVLFRVRKAKAGVGQSRVFRRHGAEERRGEGMSSWIRDVRIACRGLARRPGFSAGVALTLGLGIGATTTIYSVVDAVLLRPLPYETPGRLAAVGTTFPTREWDDEEAGLQHLAGMAMLNFRDFVARTRSFDLLAAIEASSSVLLPDRGSGPELAPAARVSSALFDMLDVTPALGRTFLPEEHSVAAEPVFLITYGAWQRRYGGDPDIVGRPFERIGGPATIIGVLPSDFRAPEAFFSTIPDFWMPLQPDHPRYASRGMRSLYIAGRLTPGVSVDEARAEADAIAADLAVEFPDGNVYPDGSHFGIGVNGLHAQTVGTAGRPLRIFLGAATLLLLLAAMNAATLLLARALDRGRELGVRMALGAGRARVMRLLLTEAGVLSLAGGAVGVTLAYGGVVAFLRYAPSSIPMISSVAVDGRVLGVATLVSLGAGLLAGLLPALRLARRGLWERFQAGGWTVADAGSRLRSVLVGGQVAVAVLLLSGAALMFSSLVRIRSAEPGFVPEGLITLEIALKRPDAPASEPWQDWDAAITELGTVPGVESVAGTTNPPFQSPYWAPRLLLPGDSPETWREGVAGYAITPGYLETVGTELVGGRGLFGTDGPDAEQVALVNETFVRTHLNGEDPLGLIVRQVEDGTEHEIRIVGVVEDVIQGRAEEGRRAAIYVPYTQASWPLVHAVVRTPLPPETIVPELRRAVARFNPVVPPRDVRTMPDRMADSRTTPRFQTLLIGSFALVALLLAGAGVYGSLAHTVGRRRRELGVRMALGAERAGLIQLVLRQGLRATLIGVALGSTATLATASVLESFLYEVEPHDPAMLGLVAAVLVLVSVSACIVPARRATAVDPVTVLRAE